MREYKLIFLIMSPLVVSIELEHLVLLWCVYCFSVATMNCAVAQHLGNKVSFANCFVAWLVSPATIALFIIVGNIGRPSWAVKVYALLFTGKP